MSGDRTRAGAIAARPPAADFFDRPEGTRPGGRAATLDFGGLAIGFDGMDAAWHAAFLDRYRPWARDATRHGAAPDLTLAVTRGEIDHFIAPPPPGVSVINPLALEVDRGVAGHSRIRACTFGLAATFSTGGGRGRAVFARGDYDPRERSVENILRVATAWLAVMRGGLLMHSASIVDAGRACLFFGQSGSGKSTISALTRRGRVVSDDLTLILPGPDGRPHVVGTPFRGTYTAGSPVTGRFPVRAGFRLRKCAPEEPTRVEPLRRSLATAEAIANLPFLVDQLHARPELFGRVERVFSAFPILTLRFRRDDPDFWDALDAAGI